MPKVLREVAGFIALPMSLNATVYPHNSKHYVYIKQHEPRIADENASRSLFLVNIPVSTSEIHIRHLFATQLSAGRVERVEFAEDAPKQSNALVASVRSSKKRKRMTAEEMEAGLDTFTFPETLPGQIHSSGSTAVVVFVDKPSMDMSLKAAKRAIKQRMDLVWGAGLDEQAPAHGLKRYEAHKSLQYPPRATLLRIADNFMTAYGAMEEARSKENARKRQMPDEDGFITVTRGAKGGALKPEEADELKEKQRAKEQGLEDFYRFQMREKRKEQQGQLLRKFDEDKKRVAEMRMRRGKLQPET